MILSLKVSYTVQRNWGGNGTVPPPVVNFGFFQDILSDRSENFRAPNMIQETASCAISRSSDHPGYPYELNFGHKCTQPCQFWKIWDLAAVIVWIQCNIVSIRRTFSRLRCFSTLLHVLERLSLHTDFAENIFVSENTSTPLPKNTVSENRCTVNKTFKWITQKIPEMRHLSECAT